MKSNIFIPKKIKVGFQDRSDTYTQKLAYIIYYDEKGVLRKETSWNGWRDKKIDPVEFDNVPTSGFVLNKKVGGYNTGWNHRQTYVRIYDSRNFEFEISVSNLLYILENTNSIKGKGLEGEFVYGWDGKDLILIPTSSPDYEGLVNYNKIIDSKNYIKAKNLILGATYRNKNNHNYIYMGKFDNYDYYGEYYDKQYYFYNIENKIFDSYKSLGNKFIEEVSKDCVENYAELFDRLEHTKEYSPIDNTKDEYISFTFEYFVKLVNLHTWYVEIFNNYKQQYQFRILNNNKIMYWSIRSLLNDDTVIDTIENMFEQLKPMYRNIYLKNGKLYSSGGNLYGKSE